MLWSDKEIGLMKKVSKPIKIMALKMYRIVEKKETLNALEFQPGLICPGHTRGVFRGLSVDRCGKSSTEQAALFLHVRWKQIAECERPFRWSKDTSARKTSHFTCCSKRLPKIPNGTREQKQVL